MKLTVLIPVYNTPPHHLLESVYSVLLQDDNVKHDIILIDDKSDRKDTKNSLAILENNNSNIKLLFLDKNGGTSIALNEGHKLVKTEYVAIMGSDDVSDLSRLRKQVDYLKANPNVDVLGTNLFMFYDNDIRRKSYGTTTHEENPNITKDWFINHGTVIYKQKVVEEMNGYNPAYKRGQDVELWKRIKNTGRYTFANITECLYGWRRYRK